MKLRAPMRGRVPMVSRDQLSRPSLSFNFANNPSLVGTGGTLTLVRATTATLTDQDVIVRSALSGGARMQGYRRVQNLYASSATLGTQGVTTIAATYTASFTGTGTITFSGTFAGTLVGQGASARVCRTFTCTAGTLTSTITGTCTNGQLELVAGQVTQVAAEYVDSATSYGLGNNGVRAFANLNGNTVVAELMTEATGALISASIRQGLLVEPAAANIILRSDELDTVGVWGPQNITVTANQYAAANGTTTAEKLTTTAASALHYIGETALTFSAATYTSSADLRYVNNRWGALGPFDGVTQHLASFDLLNGVVGVKSAAVTASSIAPTGVAGVYRCTMTCTVAATAAGVFAIVMNDVDANTIRTWLGAGELMGASGAGMELGAVATSRIPTTTVAVTRDKDVYSRALGGEYNPTAGTLYADFIQPVADAVTRVALALDDGTANNRILIYTVSGTNFCLITVGGVAKFSASIAAPAAGVRTRISFAYAVNDGISYQNNVAMTIATAGTTLPTVTTFNAGNAASADQLGSTIANAVLYPARLTNARTQALTA